MQQAPSNQQPDEASVLNLLDPLNELVAEHQQNVDLFIEGLLALLAQSLDVGLTFLSRVEGPSLHILHAHDRAGIGLHGGDMVPLCDTY